MVGAIVAGLGSALEACSVRWWMFVLGRMIAGGTDLISYPGWCPDLETLAGEGLYVGPCGGMLGLASFDLSPVFTVGYHSIPRRIISAAR